jgi:L-threonylcarbamoyladenylate synthase
MSRVVAVEASPSRQVIGQAADALRAGEAIVLPTETVYGLAALASVPGATARLFELKGRGPNVPVAVLCADVEQALALADSPGAVVREVAEKHWPGPLTLVLRRRPHLEYALGEPAATIGLRCPDHALVRALAREVGPIATTSANRHGEPTPQGAAEVAALFGDGVALVIDGGPCTGTPSTVIDAVGDQWKVLRQGEVSVDLAG